MRAIVSRSRPSGRVAAPPSKSYTIRALMCAALAQGESTIIGPLVAEDTGAAARVLRQVGVEINDEGERWLINSGPLNGPAADLFCGDSALTLRFMTAICTLVPGRCALTAGPSLSRRPVGPLVEVLRQLGADVSSADGFPPVTVNGGRLRGDAIGLGGDVSSQFLSALLLVAPCTGGLAIRLTTPLESRPYVLMTIEMMDRFGVKVGHSMDMGEFSVARQEYRPARVTVEGDWSAASHLLALGALAGDVTTYGVNPSSLQADRRVISLLEQMGAPLTLGPESVRARNGPLRPIIADLSDSIDLLPAVAVLATAARGSSKLGGLRRARLKESDRVAGMAEGLGRMGIDVDVAADLIVITGGTPKGATIDPHGDHRLAMAFGALGTLTDGTVIEDAGCVAKSFPGFWDTLRSLGVEVRTV